MYISISILKTDCPHIYLKGIFSHDGSSYNAENLEACRKIDLDAQARTLGFVKIAWEMSFAIDTVSIGSTPSLMHDFPILPGITELRPGTYILMDASQANAYGSQDRCAVTVLATVISKPTDERVILDVGAKGIIMQTRTQGICAEKYIARYSGQNPEIFRLMALKGARMIFVPTSFNMTTGPAHWTLSARMRALDNQVFLLGCQPERDSNGSYVAWGHSILTDPWGNSSLLSRAM